MRKQMPRVNMDNKQRVCLTRVLSKQERENFDTFRIYRKDGKIVLEPVAQVPEKDHWIYKNPKALASLLKGIKDAEEGRVTSLGSFAKYAKEDTKKRNRICVSIWNFLNPKLKMIELRNEKSKKGILKQVEKS